MPTTKRKPVALRRAEEEIMRLKGELAHADRNTAGLAQEIEDLDTRLDTANRDADVASGENGFLRQLLEQISSVANGSPFFPVTFLERSVNRGAATTGGFAHTPVGSGDPMYGETLGRLDWHQEVPMEEQQRRYNLEQQRNAVEFKGRLDAIAALCQTAARAITNT